MSNFPALSVPPTALFVMEDWAFKLVYGTELHEEISSRVRVIAPPLTAARVAADRSVLRDVEVLFTSWGIPTLDAEFMAAAPRLRAVFHGAGSIRGPATPAFWARGIPIVSAYSVNAIPVAEYSLAAILFGLKHGFRYLTAMQRERQHVPKLGPVPGAFRSTVGLVSLGAIGRRTADLLRPFDLRVIAYDPYCLASDAAELGVTLVGLEELFAQSDAVSLHVPWMPETEGMITGALLRRMKPGATLINTARGAIVREDEMIEVLRGRPDLTAVLDVTWPEPPAEDSPLFSLPNVMLTPHLAGAMDGECRRLGHLVREELDRFLTGQPLRWAISPEQAQRMA